MARVTVEDCVKLIPNRFELVMMASKRTREISSGAAITLPRNNDKNPVVALREIAEETISLENLHNNLLKSLQRTAFIPGLDESIDEDTQELILSEQAEWARPDAADDDLLSFQDESDDDDASVDEE